MNTCNKYYKRELQNRKLSSLTKLIDSLLIAHSQHCCWLALHGLLKRGRNNENDNWDPDMNDVCPQYRFFFHCRVCREGWVQLEPLQGGFGVCRPRPCKAPSCCRPQLLQKQEKSPRPVKCGLIWSLNIQTANSGGGRKPSCQFYMEYLRHLRVTGDEAILPSVSKCPVSCRKAHCSLGHLLSTSRRSYRATRPAFSLGPVAGGTCRLWAGASRRAAMAVLPLRTRQLRTCLIYQLHLKSSTTRTNTLQFPLLQLLHSLCLNY